MFRRQGLSSNLHYGKNFSGQQCSRMRNNVDIFTKAVFRYDHAVASFQIGLGVKTEGAMTIAGTNGYVYVPAPWWKTDYFEIRYDDQNKKLF